MCGYGLTCFYGRVFTDVDQHCRCKEAQRTCADALILTCFCGCVVVDVVIDVLLAVTVDQHCRC